MSRRLAHEVGAVVDGPTTNDVPRDGVAVDQEGISISGVVDADHRRGGGRVEINRGAGGCASRSCPASDSRPVRGAIEVQVDPRKLAQRRGAQGAERLIRCNCARPDPLTGEGAAIQRERPSWD